jgi:hypothetical protein
MICWNAELSSVSFLITEAAAAGASEDAAEAGVAVVDVAVGSRLLVSGSTAALSGRWCRVVDRCTVCSSAWIRSSMLASPSMTGSLRVRQTQRSSGAISNDTPVPLEFAFAPLLLSLPLPLLLLSLPLLPSSCRFCAVPLCSVPQFGGFHLQQALPPSATCSRQHTEDGRGRVEGGSIALCGAVLRGCPAGLSMGSARCLWLAAPSCLAALS